MRFSRGLLIGLAFYVATFSIATWLLWSARNRLLTQLDAPESQAAWQEWKRQEEQRVLDGGSSVDRRPPSSEEPPTLVLLRDHFPAVLVSAWIVGSVLFAFTAWIIHGVLTMPPMPPLTDAPAKKP